MPQELTLCLLDRARNPKVGNGVIGTVESVDGDAVGWYSKNAGLIVFTLAEYAEKVEKTLRAGAVFTPNENA